MYQITLNIETLPKSLNKAFGAGRWGRSKQNKMFDLMIASMLRGSLPAKPLQKAHISLTRHFYRTLDYDGLVGSLKPVVDALVTAGLLIDDNWKVLGVWDCDQKFRAKKLGPLLVVKVTQVID